MSIERKMGHSIKDGTKYNNDSYAEKFLSDWSPPKLDTDSCHLKIGGINDHKKTTLDDFISKSDAFPIKFPINSVRCRQLKNTVTHDQLENNINSTYPIVHEGTLKLFSDFLEIKKRHGSNIEKNFYKDFDILKLAQRLLECRAASFWGPRDVYLLISGEEGMGKWETIGSDEEKPPLLLANNISYDEIKLSALLYVSGFSQFINDGFRKNSGVPASNKRGITEHGVIIGLIGARLKKKHVMEYQEIIVTKEQNTVRSGYGSPDRKALEDSNAYKKQKLRQMWADFYEEPNNTYEVVHKTVIQGDQHKEQNQFSTAKAKGAYFDNFYYKKRLILTIDTLLIEANHRAKSVGKMAYIHMVGIGLGVWCNADHQEATFLDVFAQRLLHLKECIRNISDVHFAYFKLQQWNEITDGKKFLDAEHPNGGVTVHISKREPSSRLVETNDEDTLLVVTYAWDGNAQPGNEFWMGKLKSSGDSAAASSSQVSELHNSLINTENVNVNNLHVASRDYGVVHISQYLKKLQQVMH